MKTNAEKNDLGRTGRYMLWRRVVTDITLKYLEYPPCCNSILS